MLRAPLLMLALLGQLDESGGLGGPNGPIFSTASGTSSITPCAQGALSYSLFADAGDQSNYAADLCDVAADAGVLSGSYFCLRPDAGVTGAALTATGSPPTVSHSQCGNGAYCADTTFQGLDGTTQYFSTASVASPTGSFTLCSAFKSYAASGQPSLVSKTAAAGVNGVKFYVNGGTSFCSSVYTAAGSTTVCGAAGSIVPRARHFACARYTYVANNTSALKIFVDGASSGTPSTTAVGPMRVFNGSWGVGIEMPSTSLFTGAVGNAFFTETALDDATILALSNAALGVTTPTLGTAPTIANASVKRCPNTAGTELTVIPTNKACITKGGMYAEGIATNNLLQSSVLSTTWTATNMTCVNTALHPDGTLLASRCTATAANGKVCQTVTVASSTRATSAFLKHPVGVGTINVSRDNLSTRIDVTSSLNASTYFRVTPQTHAGLSTTSANPTICFEAVTSGDAIDVALAQDEAGASATLPIETTVSSTARTADAITFPNTLTPGNPPAWCLGATLDPVNAWGSTFTGGGADRRLMLLGTAAGAANSGYLAFLSARTPNLLVYNSAATLKQMAGAAVTADTTAHRLVGASTCGELALYLDGASAGTTSSGTGTGLVATQPATVNLTDVAAGSRQARGVVSNIKQASSTTGCN